jgi:uncharacterized phage-associated protein
MYSSIAIAEYFLHKAQQDKIPVSNMKLQKLVYIAHGLYLASNDGNPLLEDRVEAWPYGPVIKPLYDEFKMYGNETIPYDPGSNGKEPPFTPEAKDILDLTWDTFKTYEATQLSNWTHNEDSPWTSAIAKENKVISDEEMKTYFKQFITHA